MKSFGTLALLLVMVTAPAATAPAAAQSSVSLLGTWDVVLTFSDGTPVKSALTVLPGRSVHEGSIIHAAEASLLLPTPTTSEQGSWEQVGKRRFVAEHHGFAVDGTFSFPAGRVGFRHRIDVAPDSESFVGVATFEVTDPAGAVLFTDSITTAGTRQHPSAP